MTTTIILSNNGFEGTYLDSAKIKIEKDGKLIQKVVSIDDVKDAINSNCITENSMMYLGKIPSYFYDGYIKNDTNKFSCHVIFILPRKKRFMNYKHKAWWIPFPTLAFQFSVTNNFLTESKVFAIKGDVDDKQTLCYFPFGNVYESGKICWGNINLPEIPSLWKLKNIVDLFFETSSNEELFRKPENIADFHEFLTLLENKKTFPKKFLVSSNFVLESLIKE